MAQLSPYLSFQGTCRDAFTFYQSCLGGKLNLQTFADSPMAAQVPADMQDRILHGSLSAGTLTLLGSDAGDPRTPFIEGTNVGLCLNCESDEEITTLFLALAEGGTILDPLADVFWGGKFGALTDRFGLRWILNYQKAPAQ
ncbi:VOC family protein [Hymenobacter terrenus]|uniref:VOC family protein n=1 Tax=Hymenobacter terrenus TaxID=1629124 RepID=UPI0006199F2F|nr:VOC family protein [Hymenobacter terrenus]